MYGYGSKTEVWLGTTQVRVGPNQLSMDIDSQEDLVLYENNVELLNLLYPNLITHVNAWNSRSGGIHIVLSCDPEELKKLRECQDWMNVALQLYLGSDVRRERMLVLRFLTLVKERKLPVFTSTLNRPNGVKSYVWSREDDTRARYSLCVPLQLTKKAKQPPRPLWAIGALALVAVDMAYHIFMAFF